jgi:hypothetical protein
MKQKDHQVLLESSTLTVLRHKSDAAFPDNQAAADEEFLRLLAGEQLRIRDQKIKLGRLFSEDDIPF